MEKLFFYSDSDALSALDPETYVDDVEDVELDIYSLRDDVKRILDEKLILARKYGFSEYADEICALMAKLDEIGKYIRSL